jgi:trk system potassium uptake protein TrkH
MEYKTKNKKSKIKVFLSSIIAPALIVQIAPAIGFFATYLVSVSYYFLKDSRFPIEDPNIPLIFTIINLILFGIGLYFQKIYPPKENISLRRGAWIVFYVWLIACSISALYFVVNGFPVPNRADEFTFLRQFIDGFYESMSGYTTTGASILPSVEVFPRSLLFWRTLLHWIGGMGIVYMAITLWENFKSSRQAVINSEAEAHEIVYFSSQKEARDSGWSFLRAYALLSSILLILLFISGTFFRATPYQNWYDNAFDSVTHMFSTIGTGGFSTYDLSAGLPSKIEDGKIILGGLQNKVSEWILSFFMLFSGINFSLWYILFFSKNKKPFWKNTEHKVYWAYVLICTFGIVYFLWQNGTYQNFEQIFRYAFFNVASIVSTTGLANWDFTTWQNGAIGFLFVCYLVGSMVGSTGGGTKVIRFIVSYKHIKRQLVHLIYGKDHGHFVVDEIEYGSRKSALVVATIAIYFFIFILGAILLLVFSGNGVLPDGKISYLDFGTAIASSIANLGNIGPGIFYGGGFNIGPVGNYYAFSLSGKIILILLMYIGRVGVLAVIMLFLKSSGEERFFESVPTVKFNKEQPVLKQ